MIPLIIVKKNDWVSELGLQGSMYWVSVLMQG